MAEQDAVNALVHLGLRISRVCMSVVSHLAETDHSQGPQDKDTKKRLKQKPSSEEEYELSRYKPLLRTVIEVCLLVTLSVSQTERFLPGTCWKQA